MQWLGGGRGRLLHRVPVLQLESLAAKRAKGKVDEEVLKKDIKDFAEPNKEQMEGDDGIRDAEEVESFNEVIDGPGDQAPVPDRPPPLPPPPMSPMPPPDEAVGAPQPEAANGGPIALRHICSCVACA